MRRKLFLLLFMLLFSVLPAAAQADELAGTWIGFIGSDFEIMRFDPGKSRLDMIDTMSSYYTEFSGTYQTDGKTVTYERSDGETDQMTYTVSGSRMDLDSDWFGSRTFTKIDDSFYPEDPEASPYIGDRRQYIIEPKEDGTLRICEYIGEEVTVDVPSAVFGIPVTEIADHAFSYRDGIRELTIPDGITAIGNGAFAEDYGLEEILLPDTLESLGAYAFSYCGSLKEVVIPEGLKALEEGTFLQCGLLEKILLPESIDEIHPEAFSEIAGLSIYGKQGSSAEQFCAENGYSFTALDDTELEEILSGSAEFPEPVRSLDDRLAGTWISFDGQDFTLFRFSPDGSDLTILESRGYYPETDSGTWESDGETITYTGIIEGYYEKYTELIPYYFDEDKLVIERDFQRVCDRIDDSRFPEDIEACPYLGEEKEYWISRLEDGTIRIDAYTGTDESLSIPETVFGIPVTAIGETAFMSNATLKHVIIPHGVTFIGRQAFSNASALESAELPDTLQTLEYCAFEFCENLKEIVIPEGVTLLDTDTFDGCDSLKRAVLPASLEAIADFAFETETRDSILFIVPKGSFAENYCRENGLTCFTADGEQLTGKTDQYDGDGDGEGGAPADTEEETSGGSEELYNEAMALYNDEKYYSARRAFLMSGYGNWEEMAEKCVLDWPASGEIWHDRTQWLQDMELTISVEQPRDTAMLIRIFKDNAPVSYLFIAGSDSVTVRLPGNGTYAVKDGVGYEWYGIKEAFGPDGSYESMTFDENGTETVFLQSYYAYTLSINVSEPTPGGKDVFSESEDWESFAVGE